MRSNVTRMRGGGNRDGHQNRRSSSLSQAGAQRIARAIAMRARLPEGDGLVPAIGNGNECSNLAALASWVERMHPAVADRDDREQVTALADRLRADLNEWVTSS